LHAYMLTQPPEYRRQLPLTTTLDLGCQHAS
jgi:hypothetical protein